MQTAHRNQLNLLLRNTDSEHIGGSVLFQNTANVFQ